jgi:hypothetical protein
MTHWNYRVIQFQPEGFGDEPPYREIHEVHYEGDVPVAYSDNPAWAGWDVTEGDDSGRLQLQRMLEAIDKPVLFDSDFCIKATPLNYKETP